VKEPSGNSTDVLDALTALREEVRRLGERVASLESAGARSQESGVRSQETGPSPRTPEKLPAEEGISEEVLAVISAAIAAYLGKKPSIRQIRLLGTAAWAQQGRVTIQASHTLSARQPRSPH
jgi:methylmalonyl-CoA carboxyltransferase large subunit